MDRSRVLNSGSRMNLLGLNEPSEHQETDRTKSLVIGATGLVGGYIVERLVRSSQRPLALSRAPQDRTGVDWRQRERLGNGSDLRSVGGSRRKPDIFLARRRNPHLRRDDWSNF